MAGSWSEAVTKVLSLLLLLLLLGVSKSIEFWFRIREVVERAKLDFYRHFVSLSLLHTLSLRSGEPGFVPRELQQPPSSTPFSQR